MKIYGTIVDSKGEPLPLANITIINGKQAKKFGATADIDGNFSLENAIIDDNSQFEVSYLGFQSKKLKPNELQGKSITLVDANPIELSGVTVFGKPLPKKTSNTLANFKEHLSAHKYIYAGLGGLVGILLITSTLKK
ncbi:MAG: carboxypeptidase regulatory-like domain-containing protein [Flavobacterium sp.]